LKYGLIKDRKDEDKDGNERDRVAEAIPKPARRVVGLVEVRGMVSVVMTEDASGVGVHRGAVAADVLLWWGSDKGC